MSVSNVAHCAQALAHICSFLDLQSHLCFATVNRSCHRAALTAPSWNSNIDLTLCGYQPEQVQRMMRNRALRTATLRHLTMDLTWWLEHVEQRLLRIVHACQVTLTLYAYRADQALNDIQGPSVFSLVVRQPPSVAEFEFTPLRLLTAHRLVASFPNLIALDLQSSGLTFGALEVRALAAAQKLTRLTCCLSARDALLSLGRMRSLTDLSLDMQRYACTESALDFGVLATLPLVALSISSCSLFTNTSLRLLAPIPLTCLSLCGCRLVHYHRHQGVRTVSTATALIARQWPRLLQLTLADPGLNDDALRNLRDLHDLGQFTCKDAVFVRSGLHHLARLCIEELHLENDVCLRLSPLLEWKAIQRLSIRNLACTTARDLKALLALPQLQKVVVSKEHHKIVSKALRDAYQHRNVCLSVEE